MEPLSANATSDSTASKAKKPQAKQVASRYLQSAIKAGSQQLEIPQTTVKPAASRQGFSARTTGKWGSSHQNSNGHSSQSSSSLHLIDISTAAPAQRSMHFAAPDSKISKRFVPSTPAVPELPESQDTWASTRSAATKAVTRKHAASSHNDYSNGTAAPMDVDDDQGASTHSQELEYETDASDPTSIGHNGPSSAGQVAAKQTEFDKHQERLRLLEEYRQRKHAVKLQTQKKAPPQSTSNGWRNSMPGVMQHGDPGSRRDSIRGTVAGPRLSRPSSPGQRRMTISNPPPKFSQTFTSAIPGPSRDSMVVANSQQEAAVHQATQAFQHGKVTEMALSPEPASPASRPSSIPSPSSSDTSSHHHRDHQPSPKLAKHASTSGQMPNSGLLSKQSSNASSNGLMPMTGPGLVGPGSGTWLRESLASTGSGSYHMGPHSGGDKPMTEMERAEQLKRRKRNIQKWELQYRHLNLRAAQAMKQRRIKTEGEIEAMVYLTEQQLDEAAALERQAARHRRAQQLEASLALQLPLLEQHNQQQAQSTAVLNSLHQGLLAALTHVPLINGACVGSNPGAPDLAALQHTLRKGVAMMKDLQPALERLLSEPLLPSIPSLPTDSHPALHRFSRTSSNASTTLPGSSTTTQATTSNSTYSHGFSHSGLSNAYTGATSLAGTTTALNATSSINSFPQPSRPSAHGSSQGRGGGSGSASSGEDPSTSAAASEAVAAVGGGKGGVELAAEVARELAQTMSDEVQQLQECCELLQRLKEKENHNASYRVQLVEMKQAGLI